jgi:hypothetical protein
LGPAAGSIDAELSLEIRKAIWEKFVFLVGLSAATINHPLTNRTHPYKSPHAQIPVGYHSAVAKRIYHLPRNSRNAADVGGEDYVVVQKAMGI